MVLKSFFKKLCERITYWRTFLSFDTVIGSLKNYLRKWFVKEPWFERIFVEPEMVPQRFSETFIGSLKNYLSKWFFREPWFEKFCVEPEIVL